MKILVIDTTGAAASVSVINEKREIFSELSDDQMSHLQMLMPMVERVLKKADTKKEDITHVAAAVGPGSFTGIRIGVATAVILAQAWNLPMTAISSLGCYAYAFENEKNSGVNGDKKIKEDESQKTLICPMIDARHGQTFCSAFFAVKDENGEVAGVEIVKAEKLRDGSEFVEAMKKERKENPNISGIIFCGDGADRYAGDGAVSVTDEQLAHAAAAAALCQIQGGQIVSHQEIQPVYLRESEAERKLKAKELGKKKKAAQKPEILFELPPADEKITYRTASANDAAAVAELDKLCFRTAWSLSSFEGELDGSKNTLYIAAENSKGEIIGFAGIAYVLDEGEVNRVAVHPLYRVRGIADRMMEMLLSSAEEKGIKIQFLEVREANRQAIALYKNHGFSVIGKREGYYAETGENALIMRRE